MATYNEPSLSVICAGMWICRNLRCFTSNYILIFLQ